MTLLVAGILLGIGVPNVMEFQRNGAMTAAANNLVTGLLMARSEAVKRQAPVTVCLSDNPLDAAPVCQRNATADSTRGFIVFVDENNNLVDGVRVLTDPTDGNALFDPGEQLLMQSPTFTDTIRVSANCGYVSYGLNGYPRTVTGFCVPATALLYCDDRGRRVAAGDLSAARLVLIDQPGRGLVQQELAQISAVMTGAGALAAQNPTCPL